MCKKTTKFARQKNLLESVGKMAPYEEQKPYTLTTAFSRQSQLLTHIENRQNPSIYLLSHGMWVFIISSHKIINFNSAIGNYTGITTIIKELSMIRQVPINYNYSITSTGDSKTNYSFGYTMIIVVAQLHY